MRSAVDCCGGRLAHLLGQRTTHVAAGTVTVIMPASDACIAGNGQLEIVPPMIAAAPESASATACPLAWKRSTTKPGRSIFYP